MVRVITMTEKTRKGSTVTVTVENPLVATNEELLMALAKQNSDGTSGTERVEYINSRKEDGRVCFGVTWEANQ